MAYQDYAGHLTGVDASNQPASLALTTTSPIETDSIDLLTGAANAVPGVSQIPDPTDGELAFFEVTITTAVSGSSPTVSFELVTASDAALTANVTVHYRTPAYDNTQLTANAKVLLPIKTLTNGVEPDALSTTNDRYLGVRAVTTGTVSTGAARISQTIGRSSAGPRHYGSGFTV